MKILCLGGGFVNKGAEAMLRTVEKQLQARFTPLTLCVNQSFITGDKSASFVAAGFEVLTQPRGSKAPKTVLVKRMGSQPLHALDIWRKRRNVYRWYHLVSQIDAVVDISGFAYADGRDIGMVSYAAHLAEEMLRQGKPYILMPQAWGPFEQDSQIRDLTRQLCLHATLFYARDTESRQHLATLLNRPVEAIDLAPDITFAFEHSGSAIGWQRLADLGIKPHAEPIVCIAPNMRIYERAEGFGSENHYIKLLVEVTRQLLDQGATLLLLPHEIKPGINRMDDRFLCDIIRLMVHEPNRVMTVMKDQPTEDLKAMVSCCDLLVGSRFHAIMAAVHSRVPVVAVGWTHKYQEIMRAVGLDSFVLNYEQAETTSLIEMITKAWEQRSANRAILEQTIPPLEARAKMVFERLETVIKTRY